MVKPTRVLTIPIEGSDEQCRDTGSSGSGEHTSLVVPGVIPTVDTLLTCTGEIRFRVTALG